jgi:hypothetical protein
MNFTDLGFTAEELRNIAMDRAAEKLCAEVMGVELGEYAEEVAERVERKVKEQVETAIRPAIDAAVTKTLQPFVEGQLEQIVFQKTNEWGEPKGGKQTFRELLIQRAEAWLVEPVNFKGKSASEDIYSTFRKAGTRVAYMVDKHLQHHIESAMKAALQTANSKIAEGINEAVKIKLNEIVVSLKTEVKTK